MTPPQLIISVASGKGGTGKTTIATNMAAALAGSGMNVMYVDCDVEEPDGHVFLKPDIEKQDKSTVLIPRVNPDRCSYCGECSRICQFNAIAVLHKQVLVFPELCHSCGGCALVCPEDAIEEVQREIGTINSGTGYGIGFAEGRLTIGEAMASPLIKAVKNSANSTEIIIVDAPPGTSCPVIEAVAGSDFVILVTEPTPFGLHDLKLAVGMLREMKLSFGVVVNRAGTGTNEVYEFCSAENIEILLNIPFDRKIAEAYSHGRLVTEYIPGLGQDLHELYDKIAARVTA